MALSIDDGTAAAVATVPADDADVPALVGMPEGSRLDDAQKAGLYRPEVWPNHIVTPIIVVVSLVLCSLIPWPVKVLLGTTGAAHAPLHIASFAAAALMITERLLPNMRVWTWIGMVALGVVIEVIQWTMFRHEFEWLDVVYDATGVGIAVLACCARGAPSYKREVQ